MKSERPKIACIMKYVIFGLIIGFVVLLMLYMSGSNKPFQDVEKAVEKSLDKKELSRQKASGFKRNFGLNAADYAGVMYYSSGASMSADEVLIVKVKSNSQVQEITAAIENRLSSRISDFEGYAPEEVKLLEDAKQSVRGKYIFYAVSEDAERYMSVFGSSL